MDAFVDGLLDGGIPLLGSVLLVSCGPIFFRTTLIIGSHDGQHLRANRSGHVWNLSA